MSGRPRPCLECGIPALATRCTGCAAARDRVRREQRPTQYDAAHAAARRSLRSTHPGGPCWRCGLPGAWDAGLPTDVRLETGHLPDGAGWAPEHASCNRRAGAIASNARQARG